MDENFKKVLFFSSINEKIYIFAKIFVYGRKI